MVRERGNHTEPLGKQSSSDSRVRLVRNRALQTKWFHYLAHFAFHDGSRSASLGDSGGPNLADIWSDLIKLGQARPSPGQVRSNRVNV